MKKIIVLVLLLAGLNMFNSCKKETTTTVPVADTLTPYALPIPYNFPLPVIPDDNKPYVQRIALGRMLYYDTRLSNDGRACASCHLQQNGFWNTSPYAATVLPHQNLAWNYNFMWDGSKKGMLEDVMLFEVEGFFATDVNKINGIPEYRALFKKYYNTDTITSKNLAYALAQFIRSLVSYNSKYELYLQHKAKFTSEEYAGYTIFFSEVGDCYHCHTAYTMTDNIFHNTGLDDDYSKPIDQGLYAVTGNTTDIGKFRTPNLRNCALRTRFMHDGRFKSLEEVIEHYNSGVKMDAENLDPIMTKPGKINGLKLTAEDKKNLLAFLRTLTDSTLITDTAFARH